jgi:hypothetical protein
MEPTQAGAAVAAWHVRAGVWSVFRQTSVARQFLRGRRKMDLTPWRT